MEMQWFADFCNWLGAHHEKALIGLAVIGCLALVGLFVTAKGVFNEIKEGDL